MDDYLARLVRESTGAAEQAVSSVCDCGAALPADERGGCRISVARDSGRCEIWDNGMRLSFDADRRWCSLVCLLASVEASSSDQRERRLVKAASAPCC